MTEEEITILQNQKEEAEKRAEEALAAAEAARAEAEKAQTNFEKVLSELKELRQKRNLGVSNNDINSKELDIDAILEQKLAAKEKERRLQELEEAIVEFKQSKTEFLSDKTGVVFDKFKETLNKFNFSDVTNKTQAKQRLEEAYQFFNGFQRNELENNYDGSPRLSSTPPVKEDVLEKETEKAIELARMDKEKFNKLKSKFGEALSGLGIN